jgi:integrase/recombinase XerC
MTTVDRMIEAHLMYLREEEYSPRTIDRARYVLYRAHRELPRGVPEAHPVEIRDWLDRFPVNQTRSTYGGHLRRCYTWAVEGDDDPPWLSHNPMARIKRPKVPRGVPSPATTDVVRLCVTQARQPFRLHCILAAYGGLRPIEIAALRRQDMTARVIVVQHGKGDKPAKLPMHPVVWRAVRDLPPGPVTRQRDGRPADARWVSSATARHVRRLGVDVTLRRLRHWYATTLLDQCGNVRWVQELMRHSLLTTTQRYTEVRMDRLQQAMLMLPDLSGDGVGGGPASARTGDAA